MSTSDIAIDQLHAFVRRPLAFRCKPAIRRGASERFVAHVGHSLNSPPTPDEKGQLKRHLGIQAEALQAFYQKHNGFLLYRDTLSDTAGIHAFSIKAWANATERLHANIRESLDDEEDDPKGLLSTVVFGTAPRSGNYFVVQTAGPSIGGIFYTDHETLSMTLFASDFDEFLRRIITDPVTLIARDLGCFARYSDGSSSTQWIPEEAIAVESRIGEL